MSSDTNQSSEHLLLVATVAQILAITEQAVLAWLYQAQAAQSPPGRTEGPR